MERERAAPWQERTLYWLFGPKLRVLVGRLDSLLQTRTALGWVAVAILAVFCIALLMVGVDLADRYGKGAGILFLATVVGAFRVLPISADSR